MPPFDGVRVVRLTDTVATRTAERVLVSLGAEQGVEEWDEATWRDVLAMPGIMAVLHDQGTCAPCPEWHRMVPMDTTGSVVICDLAVDRWPGGVSPRDQAGRWVEASTGVMAALRRYSGKGSVYPVLPVAAVGAGIVAAFATAVAMLAARPGAPVTVQAPETSGGLLAVILYAADVAAGDLSAMSDDPVEVMTPLIRVYSCAADGAVLFSAPSMDAWRRTAAALGRPDLFESYPEAPWGLDPVGKAELRSALVEELARWQAEEVCAALKAAGVSATMAGSLESFAADEHVAASGALHRGSSGEVVGGPPLLTREGTVVGRRAGSPIVTGPPLRDVRVVEVATYVAGPTAGCMLADYGAEVIKIEQPPAGDPLRESAAQFEQINRGKLSLQLDLTSEDGQRRLLSLINEADIFISNVRLGGLVRLGLTFDDLVENNPSLVYTWVSGWGSGGPRSGEPGVDPVFQVASGIAEALGGNSGSLRLLPSGFGDAFTGVLAAAGAVAGLHRARRTGYGQYVEASLMRTAVLVETADGWPRWDLGRDPMGPSSTERLYDAADGEIYIDLKDGHRVDVLAQDLGLADWSVEAVERTLAKRDVGGVADLSRHALGNAGVACPVVDLEMLLRADAAHEVFGPVRLINGSERLLLRPFVAFQGQPAPMARGIRPWQSTVITTEGNRR